MSDLEVVRHIVNATVPVIAPIIAQSIPTLQPDTAPWWLNVFIWMATFWWWILVGFVPAFYFAVTKIFGFPLLQRWSQEVVIMLYPNKVVFGKIKEQMEPYFAHGNGIYWYDTPLSPEIFQEIEPKIEEKLIKLREQYEALASPENKTMNKEKLMSKLLKQEMKLRKRMLTVDPRNTLHVYTHAVNQPITRMERRQSKIDEILNNNPTPKKIKGHGIWLLQNPKLHFHRHYQLIIDPSGSLYKLIPVKQRQKFGIGFWHSLGIMVQKEVEVEQERELESGGSNTGKQLITTEITTHVVLSQSQVVQDYQNFSASRAFMLLKRRAKIEDKYNGFLSWVNGTFDVRIILFLGIMLCAVIGIFMLFHGTGGSAPTGPATPPGVVHIL